MPADAWPGTVHSKVYVPFASVTVPVSVLPASAFSSKDVPSTLNVWNIAPRFTSVTASGPGDASMVPTSKLMSCASTVIAPPVAVFTAFVPPPPPPQAASSTSPDATSAPSAPRRVRSNTRAPRDRDTPGRG
jgi:hypothetical protein